MSAGLAASTVTPGIARPSLSLTTPAMPLACCAHAAGAASATMQTAARTARNFPDLGTVNLTVTSKIRTRFGPTP